MLIESSQGKFTPRSARVPAAIAGAIPLLTLTLLIAACATAQKQLGAAPVPVEDHDMESAPPAAGSRTAPPGQAQSAPPVSGAEDQAAPPRTSAQDPVVMALLAQADVHLNRGQPESAAAVLERALRLAPEDALLWHRMARLRLEQGRWQQAIVFARKSESLASANTGLRAANARLIARAVEMSKGKN